MNWRTMVWIDRYTRIGPPRDMPITGKLMCLTHDGGVGGGENVMDHRGRDVREEIVKVSRRRDE